MERKIGYQNDSTVAESFLHPSSSASAPEVGNFTLATPSPEFSIDGYHERLQKIYNKPPIEHRGEVGRQYYDNVIAVIPIHNDPKRLESLKIAIEGIRRNQTNGQNIHVIIANNGLSHDMVEGIQNQVKEKGLKITIVDATPRTDGEKNPAYARNVALGVLKERAREDDAYRGNVFVLDSDGSPSPNAIKDLKETLYQKSDAVAVSADVISVARLDQTAYEVHAAANDTREAKTRALPSLWTPNGKVDMGAIVAFSSQVAGKTNGTLMEFDTTMRILRRTENLYAQMPNKSAEDMIAATTFSREGVIYQSTKAKVLDEARETVEQTVEQQARWGRDHVLLTEFLKGNGLLEEDGIHVIEPGMNTWVEWVVPGTKGIGGYIINPAEITQTAVKLDQLFENGNALADAPSIRRIELGMSILERIMKLLNARRNSANNTRTREDLPKPTKPDPSNPRFTDHTRISRLIGNIEGLADIYNLEELKKHNVLPDVVLFGTRQSGAWS